MTLNRQEVARYLGVNGAHLGPELNELIDGCEAELFAAVTPRYLSRRVALSSLPFVSADLSRHLQHCREGFLLAVTLGAACDQLLRRWSVSHMGRAAVGQACAAAWMDDCCDQYCETLEGGLAPGEFLLPPYSPGYGDFSLSYQGDLLHRLDAGRRLGVSLTAGGMLAPEKTITAVVGVSHEKTERCVQKCMRCPKTDCVFRKGT